MSQAPPIRRLLRYAHPHRRDLRMATTWSVLNKIMDIAPEILIGGAVDVVVRGEDSWLAGLGVTSVRDQLIAE